MTTEQRLLAEKNPMENNLIHLEKETRAAGQAKDINTRIGMLESSLAELKNELDVANKSVDEGLERLGDNELDLTAKVSETYKRLGEIDNTYRALSSISDNIDQEVRKLASEIEDVATRSAADLEKNNLQMTDQHEQLVERVNELVRHSHETHSQLIRSIEDNTDALLKLEKELVAEIDTLANATSERSDRLEKELETSQARILQLQAVDDALEKRAASLENSAAELTQKSRLIEASIDVLDERTGELSSTVDQLLEHSEKHFSLISALQDKSIEMAMSIRAVAGTENRHFKILSGFLLLAMLAIAGLYFYHQSEMSHDAVATAERSQTVDQQISGLKKDNLSSTAMISDVQDKLEALNQKLAGEVVALNGRMQTINDQAESLEGRVSSISPYSRIGSDNVIHGPQWLSQQPSDQFVIQVASVADKHEIYEIARRYNHYLKDDLSYYTVGSGSTEKYVLVSGGYATEQEAAAVMWRLPRYVNFQRPVVIRTGDIHERM